MGAVSMETATLIFQNPQTLYLQKSSDPSVGGEVFQKVFRILETASGSLVICQGKDTACYAAGQWSSWTATDD